jgi:hydroxymethylpyrimidine pyrophosphatase-like HAD family hydrolase
MTAAIPTPVPGPPPEAGADSGRPSPGTSRPPRLVAVDVDGTMLDHDGRLTERVRQAVAAVADAGIHIVVSTGRTIVGTLPVLDRLSLLDGWVVCSNGAVTARLDPALPGGYEIGDAVTFDPGPVLQMLRKHLPVALYAVENVGSGHRLTAPFPPGELSGHQEVVSFEDLVVGPATRVVVRSPNHTGAEFADLVSRMGLHGVSYAVGWTAWLDLAPDGVSKASGLDAVCRRLGVDPADVLAIGDGRNDVEMFAWAGRSVAMGNATPDVVAAADEVTATVDDDGLALVLERLLV